MITAFSKLSRCYLFVISGYCKKGGDERVLLASQSSLIFKESL